MGLCDLCGVEKAGETEACEEGRADCIYCCDSCGSCVDGLHSPGSPLTLRHVTNPQQPRMLLSSTALQVS